MKKFFMLLIWMGLAGFLVIVGQRVLGIQDEIAGGIYFVSIGVAASSVLNYYDKREST